MITLAIAAQKGGVGKTASALALGYLMNEAGQRILYVDLDPQANLTTQLLGRFPEGKALPEVLQGTALAVNVIQRTQQGDLLPSADRLAGKGILSGKGAAVALKGILEPLKDMYDICLIDCPPSLGALTVAALTACDSVIIPAKADRFSMDAIMETLKTIKTVKENTNPDIRVMGVLITQYNGRACVNKLTLEQIQGLVKSQRITVYPPIRRAVAVEEAQYTGNSIFATKNNAAADYRQVAETIMRQIKYLKGVKK